MTDERIVEPDLLDIDRRLRELAPDRLFPATPEFAAVVSARLASAQTSEPVGNLGSRRGTARRWWLAAAAAVLLALTSVLAVPDARSTVAGWLNIDGVRFISRDQVTTTPVAGTLKLGEQTDLDAARAQLDFTPLLPNDPALGEPDEVYVSERAIGGMLALVYYAEDGLPESANTGMGLLLTEFLGTLNPGIATKGLDAGTLVEELEVAGGHAIWIEGETHVFFYTDPTGAIVNEDLRLAGNTLLWEAGGLTMRLEGELSRDEMLRIAESMTPAP